MGNAIHHTPLFSFTTQAAQAARVVSPPNCSRRSKRASRGHRPSPAKPLRCRSWPWFNWVFRTVRWNGLDVLRLYATSSHRKNFEFELKTYSHARISLAEASVLCPQCQQSRLVLLSSVSGLVGAPLALGKFSPGHSQEVEAFASAARPFARAHRRT